MNDQPTPLSGTCSARFDPLRELFAAKIEWGEDLGALLAVNIDGEMVVDLWGGRARSCQAPLSSKGDIPTPRRLLPNEYRPLPRRRFMCFLRRMVTGRKRVWLLALLLVFLSLPVGAFIGCGPIPTTRPFSATSAKSARE
jgi:hypothetical protein